MQDHTVKEITSKSKVITKEEMQEIFQHEGVDFIRLAFKGQETIILAKLEEDMETMPQGFLFETGNLLMSWASDAQEHFRRIDGLTKGRLYQMIDALNQLKSKINAAICLNNCMNYTFESYTAFRKKYTDNY